MRVFLANLWLGLANGLKSSSRLEDAAIVLSVASDVDDSAPPSMPLSNASDKIQAETRRQRRRYVKNPGQMQEGLLNNGHMQEGLLWWTFSEKSVAEGAPASSCLLEAVQA